MKDILFVIFAYLAPCLGLGAVYLIVYRLIRNSRDPVLESLISALLPSFYVFILVTISFLYQAFSQWKYVGPESAFGVVGQIGFGVPLALITLLIAWWLAFRKQKRKRRTAS